MTTPSGMVLDGVKDAIEAPPVDSTSDDNDEDGVVNEIPTSIVDFMEFYLLHYFKAGTGQQSPDSQAGRQEMQEMGCTSCHIAGPHDRQGPPGCRRRDRVRSCPGQSLQPAVRDRDAPAHRGRRRQRPPDAQEGLGNSFVVRNIFTDFKRHDLGPNFHERDYNGTIRTQLLTTPLWGVANTGPYGHDGRSMNLTGRDPAARRRGAERARQLRETLVHRPAAASSRSSTRWCCSRRTTPPRTCSRRRRTRRATRSSDTAASGWGRCSTIRTTPSEHLQTRAGGMREARTLVPPAPLQRFASRSGCRWSSGPWPRPTE